MTEIERLAFIGLGVMGGRMCRNLAHKSGKPVIAHDVDAARVAALAEVGVNREDAAAMVRREPRGGISDRCGSCS